MSKLKIVSKDLGRSSDKNLGDFFWQFDDLGAMPKKAKKTHFILCISLYLLNQKMYFAILFRFLWAFWRYARKKILFWNFFNEFKDFWKMKGTYFFVKNELLDPETPYLPYWALKSVNTWLKKTLWGKIGIL